MADLPRVPPESDYSYQNEAGFDNSGKSGEARDDGKDAVFADILETLQENNFLLNEVEENLEEIEENTESDETASERRKRRVKEENTDKKGMFSSALGGLGAGIKGVGGILNKANPFQEGGLGTKMSILLISGVLFAISKFGDKLVNPLAAVLKMIDAEGGIFDKLKETELFKSVVDNFNKIRDYAKNELAADVSSLLEAAMSVGSLIKSAYDSIVAYIGQFDTRGAGPAGQYADGKLDALEMQNLKDDLMKKAQDLVTSIIGTVWNEISFATKLMFAAGGAVSLLLQASLVARIAKMIAGVSGKPPSAEGPTKRGSKTSMLKKIALKTAGAFTIGSAATMSSIGGTASVANLAKNMRVNSVGRVIYTKTGQYVAGSALNPSKYNLSHLAKYPTLVKIARRAPFLAPILGSIQAINLFRDPNATHDDKVVGLGRIMGEIGGAALFAKVGTALGTMALPGWGTLIGGILGAGGGYYAGGHIGEMLARFMLGDKPLIGEYGNQNIGSELNPSELNPSETVENLPIQSMSGLSSDNTLGSTAAELDANLMNKNSEFIPLASMLFKSFNKKDLSRILGMGDDTEAKGADVVLMPQIIDQSETKTFNSNYSSELGSSNLFSTVRVLNLDGVSF